MNGLRIIGQYIEEGREQDIKLFDHTMSYNYELPFSLPKEHQYIIGIDQSTTSTGVSIISMSDEDTYLDFQIMNSIYKLKSDLYVAKIVLLIHRVMKGNNVKYIFIEKVPPIFSATTNTLEVLMELQEMFEKKLASFFTDTDIYPILPSQWRSAILERKKPKGMDRKQFVVESIIEQIPSLQILHKYLQKTMDRKHDFDLIEAHGIAVGGLRYFFDEDGNPINVGLMVQIHHIYIDYFYVNQEELTNILKSLVEFFGPEMISPTVYNKGKSIYQNLVMAGSKEKFSLMMIENNTALYSFLLDYDVKKQEDKALVAFVFRTIKGQFSAKDAKKVLSSISEYNEIIYPYISFDKY